MFITIVQTYGTIRWPLRLDIYLINISWNIIYAFPFKINFRTRYNQICKYAYKDALFKIRHICNEDNTTLNILHLVIITYYNIMQSIHKQIQTKLSISTQVYRIGSQNEGKKVRKIFLEFEISSQEFYNMVFIYLYDFFLVKRLASKINIQIII